MKDIIKSERFFELVFNNSITAIILMDINGNYLSCNPRFTELTGITEDEIVSIPFGSYIHPDFIDIVKNALFKMQKNETDSFQNHIKVYTKKKQELWIDLNASAFISGDDEKKYILIEFYEITKNKENEILLKESEELFRIIADFSHDWELLRDNEGKLIYSNKTSEKISGYSKGDFLSGRVTMKDVLHPDDLETTREAIEKLLKGEYVKPLEQRIYTKNGELKYILISSNPIIVEGEVEGVRSSIKDITEEKINKKMLKQNQKELEMFFNSVSDGFFFMMLDEPIEWNENTDKEKILDYVFEHQRITKVNQAMLKHFGAKESEFLGRTPKDAYIHDIEFGRKVWREFFDKGRIRIDTKEKRIDGSDLIVVGEYVLIYDDEGRIKGHFGVQSDITEQEHFKKALIESENKFRSIIENSPFSIVVTNENGIIVECNDSFEKLTGFSKEKVVDTHIIDFHNKLFNQDENNKVNMDRLKHDIRKLYNNGDENKTISYIANVWINNQQISIEQTLFKVKKDEGFFIISMANDVTDKINVEKQLKESVDRFDLAVKGSNNGIFDWNIDTNEIYYSPLWKKQLGYEEHEIINLFDTFLQLVHPDDITDVMNYVDKYLEGEIKNYDNEFRMRHKDGSYRWIRAIGSALRDENGKPYRMLGSHTDITEKKQRELIIYEQNKDLEKLNAEKDKFISILAHDLRSPLGGIMQLTDFMKEEFDNMSDSEKINMIHAMHKSSKNVFKLLMNLLDWSRIQRGIIPYEPENHNLYNLASESIIELFDLAIKKEIILKILIDDTLNIVCDKNMIMSTLRNITSNAIKFTDKGGKIVVNASKSDNKTIINIEDNGIGMSSKIMDNIFNIEVNTSRKGTDKESGSGLGLILCKELVDKHNGEIKVTSDIDKGSTFSIIIPDKSNQQIN